MGAVLAEACRDCLPSCLPLSALLWLPISAPEGYLHPLVRQVALVSLRERNQDQVDSVWEFLRVMG